MSLAPYTDPVQVRGALGVTENDYSDEDLLLKVYETGLKEDLFDISPVLPAQFAVTMAIDEEERSELQTRFVELTQQFATYSVARQAGIGLPLKAPKSIGDGQATASRFSDSPYKDVLKRLDQSFDRSRERLAAAFEALTSSTTVRTVRSLFTVASPTEDPITGAGY